MDPGNTLRDEPTINDLIDARERADAGIRLALPQLAQRLGIGATLPTDADEPAEIVSPELADLIVDRIDDARILLREAMRLADPDRGGDRAVHVAIAELQEQVAGLTATLIGRWSA